MKTEGCPFDEVARVWQGVKKRRRIKRTERQALEEKGVKREREEQIFCLKKERMTYLICAILQAHCYPSVQLTVMVVVVAMAVALAVALAVAMAVTMTVTVAVAVAVIDPAGQQTSFVFLNWSSCAA